MTEIGGTSEPSPRKDVSGLIARRLDELAQVRGSEQVEQVATEKATGRPLPAALVLLRRLGELERDVAGREESSRREFAILRYAVGRALLDELIRQDAELSVIVNRQRGRPDTSSVLASDGQDEAVRILESQRRALETMLPGVEQLPLSLRQQRVIADVVARVGIDQPHPMQSVSPDRRRLRWPGLVAQEEAEATLAAAGADPAARRKVVVHSPRRGRSP